MAIRRKRRSNPADAEVVSQAVAPRSLYSFAVPAGPTLQKL
jgi:hypothetical protein